MPLTCNCSQCGATLRVAESYALAVVRCPRCGGDIPNPFLALKGGAADSARLAPPADEALRASDEAVDGRTAGPGQGPLDGQPSAPYRSADNRPSSAAPTNARVEGSLSANAQAVAEAHELREFVIALHQATPRTWVTTTIVVLNVLVYVAMAVAGAGWLSRTPQGLLEWGANYGPRTTGGEWWRLLAANYIHVFWWHIGMNMLVLVDVGRLVERLLGNFAFLVLYTASGVLGSLAGVYFNPYVPSAGASGAIFGLGGALLAYVLFAHQGMPRNVAARMRRGVLFFIVLNVAIGLAIPMVDNSAHLGGLTAGFLLGLVLQQPLTPGVRQRRVLRALIGAAVAGAIILVGVRSAPPLIDPQQEWTEAMEVDQHAVATFGSLLRRWGAGELSQEAFADTIEQQLLPICTERRERLSRIDGLPPHLSRLFDLLSRYLAAREESWKCFADGLRGDPARMAEYKRHLDEAQRLAEKFGVQAAE